jgi:outer membrane receptor protein involved in Fe transport
VLSLSAVDIERTGAQSLGDLFRYIPQVSSFSIGQQINNASMTVIIANGQIVNSARSPNMSGAAGRVSASVHGTAADGTLLLVDGRRVPKNNQSNGGDGYDLNGIPLAAVERVEVLLDGASAVYGADAQGGVINVILKKNYRGTELRVGYDNTFDKDAGTLTGSLTHGFSKGKLHGLVTLNWEKSNAMALRDRDFTASYDRRAFGGIDLRRNNLFAGPGRVSRSGSVPLPGLTTTAVAIPAGSSGTNLTTADYAASGPIPDLLNLAQYQDYSSTYKRRGLVASLSYEHTRWLELYSDVRWAENKNITAIEPIQAVGITIPAGYPGNPFGIPVSLAKAFFNLQPEREAIDTTDSFVVGARGFLSGDWHYDTYVSRVTAHTLSNTASGTAITQQRLDAAIAAGRQPNLFYDSTTRANPNAAGVIESLTDITSDEEKSKTLSYSVQADGPVFKLPAGNIVSAVGAERREESVEFPRRLASDTFSTLPASREVTGLFAELNVPVFATEQHVPFMNQLNLSGAFRWEDYSTGATAKNPRGGVAWRPVSWLQLRGSYGEGFKVPTLKQTNSPASTSSNIVGFPYPADPLRGGELIQTVLVTSGGNSTLRPERSQNTTAGLVLEIPFVKGLSASFDYFDNKFNDKVGAISFADRLALFPETITRGPKLPTDPASWSGRVTAVNTSPVNVASSRITGYDYGVRYSNRTPWGEVSGSLNATKYTRNESFAVTGGTIGTSITTDLLPTMISGSAFVQNGPWGTGLLATYRARSKPLITTLFVVTDTPSVIRWDWQGNYDFEKAGWFKPRRDTWLGWALRDTKLSVTIFNVLNTRPPFDYNYLPDNTVVDSRLRRYALSLRRQF